MTATLDDVLAALAELNARTRKLEIVIDVLAEDLPLAPKSRREDRKVRFDPKGWKGSSCKGRFMSQCPPKFLDQYAAMLKFFAGKEKDERVLVTRGKAAGKPQYTYTLADVGYARRWAMDKRIAGEPDEEEAPTGPVKAPFGEDDPHDPTSFEFGSNAPDASNVFDAPRADENDLDF